MAEHRWKRAAALLIAGGMLLSQGGMVSAAETEGQTEGTAVTAETMTALDRNGSPAAVSDTVLAMLHEGTVSLDEGTGYLIRTSDGCRIDPVTGEAIPEAEEETEQPPEASRNPEDAEQTEDAEQAGGTEGSPENDPAETTEETEQEDTDNTEQPGDVEQTGESEGSFESDPAETGDTTETESQQTESEQTEQTGEQEEPENESGREALIQGAQIVEVPVIVEDFRFWTVARKYGFAKEDIDIREAASEDTETRAVGYLKKDGLVYILKEEEGWFYVESGTVRGFVKTEEICTGDEEAAKLLEQYQKEAKEKAAVLGEEYTGIENAVSVAEALISPRENEAYTYLRATADQTVIPREYALVNASKLNVREGKGETFDIVGTLEKGALCYIIADREDDWIYIESGDVRGFVSREYLDTGEEVAEQVETEGEDSFAVAEQTVEPEENGALYYTLTSVKSGIPGGEIRQSLLAFASQFIGNPYIWGGTSLTEGADCSGFVQSIFREYGYELPRVAEDQAYAGTQVTVEDALPGDLVFYADESGHIYHVVIYAGEGKTIEAQSSRTGIVQGTLDTEDAVWAVRILEDSSYVYSSGNIGEVNASPDMYGEDLGTFTITYYCACELCCDVETGITATGTPVVEGRTIAVDPDVIPYGTQVIINGHVFTAEDCGGAIDGNHIDIYVNDHQTALELGRNQAEVYLVK